MKDIKGCNALLTGASRGIGVSIAHRLAEEGVNLALVARTAVALEQVRDEVSRKGIRAIAVPADLSRVESLESLVQTVERDLGPIDLLINNAAVENIAAYETLSLNEIASTISVNLIAPMLLSRIVLPGMLERKRGHIVAISSIEGLLPLPLSEVYSATKHAINGFTLCLRLSSFLYNSPVSASVICPGFVGKSGMYQRVLDTYGKKIADLNRFGTSDPTEVADAVCDAIRKDKLLVTIGKYPFRFVHLVSYVAPRLTMLTAKSIGYYEPFRFIAETKRGRRKEDL
jgi:short-subunit dehydrogenase